MSIRIREVEGITIAICGYESDEKPGDVYLDDTIHHALWAKFHRDHQLENACRGGKCITTIDEDQARLNQQEIVRSAQNRTDL